MTFESAESLSINRNAIWFRAGELYAIQDYDVSLSYPSIDDDADLVEQLEKDPQILLRPIDTKICFSHSRTILGRRPKKCYSMVLAQNHGGRSGSLQPISLNWDQNASTLKSYAPVEAAEGVFEIPNDPDTLDDSEIEELMWHSAEPKEEVVETNCNGKLDHIHLIVTEDSFYRVGDVRPLHIDQKIDDCQVFNSEKTCCQGLIVITASNGCIYGISINSSLLGATITQHLSLGSKGLWRVRKHQKEKQLVVFNSREGVCKFFEIKDPCRFEAINNLAINDSTILECTFFPNDNDNHLLLFVATSQQERLVYYCIEWDSDEPKMKKLHYLTYWTDRTFETSLPLGDKKIIVFYNGLVELVSANQLMSGETDFSRTEVPNLQSICDSFDAPNLLRVLRLENSAQFSKFEHCLVVGTVSGHINACLVDSNNRIVIYSITRFKGLKSLCSVDDEAGLDKEYPMIVISYGRTIKIYIDIREVRPLQQGLVPSFSGLTFKHTLDSSSEEATRLLVVSPIKRSGRHVSELWLTSSTSITNLQTVGPTRKLYHVCKLQDFPCFNKTRFYALEELSLEFRTRLSEELGLLGPQVYLVFGVDARPPSKHASTACFVLDLDTAESQLIELDDLLIKTDNPSFDVFLTPRYIVQVARTEIHLQSLELKDEPKRFSPGWPIDGVAHFEQSIVLWNAKEQQLQYIEDIDRDLDGKDLHIMGLYESDMNSVKEVQIELQVARESTGQLVFYVAGHCRLLKITPSLPNSERVSTLCSGQIKSLIILKNWLCFVRNSKEIIAISHSEALAQPINLDLQSRDIELRKVNDNTCLTFTTHEIVFFTLSDTGEWKDSFYELTLPPDIGFSETIIDVQVDDKNNKVILRRFDGLHVFDMSFYSWNRAKYILRSTRDTNKKFIFIEKINRMLVTNFNSIKWDCIKLTNGKTLSLDPSVLSEQGSSLIDVNEIPSEGKSVTLIVSFEKLIKLVYLIPRRGRIIIKQAQKLHFDTPLLPFTAIRPNGTFYVIRTEQKTDQHLDEGTILAFEVGRAGLKITHELSFHLADMSKILDFKLFGRDIMINHAAYRKIFLLKDIRKSMLRNEIDIVALDLSSEFQLKLLYTLNDDILIGVVQDDNGTTEHAELLLYHRSSTNAPRYHIASSENQRHDIFERAAAQEPNEDGARDHETDDDDEMDEFDEFDAFERPNRFPADEDHNRHKTELMGWPYSRIRLDHLIKDVAFDPVEQKLFVLQTNDTVLVYEIDLHGSMEHGTSLVDKHN